ncbi:YcxB family protein [Halobacillus sp. A5]|uniref:YcxB family protein n=1 Tax=Halobacillus sp. A5 TaxID=2880263 RepID=UPI0020A68862|nr:YcxB family protein [Halobacillus sp. A5]MCP3026456.1 YcxB family protein [Halobacillus sp. A5]
MKENQKIMASGKLTSADYRRHNNYHMKKVKLFYFLAAFALFFFVSFQSLEGPLLFSVIFTAIVSFLLAGIMVLFLIIMINFRATREYKKNIPLQNEAVYTFRPGNIHQKTKNATNRFKWSDLMAVHEHKDMFQLYLSKQNAMIVPKWFFQSEDDVQAFKTMVKNQSNTKQIKLRKEKQA